MTKEEYIKRVDELEVQRQQLKEDYINSMPIKPNQVVIINGKEYWLRKYYIRGYSIIPSLYEMSKGKVLINKGVQFVENWKKMKPKNQ